MKLLIIICSSSFDICWCNNIKILNDYFTTQDMEVEYCGISNQNDFHNYETIISFTYKIINTKLQFSKICDFITDYKSELCYDWYMKIRPDIRLLESINFDMLSDKAINARARVYWGPRKIIYGMSVNGPGKWKNIGNCYYADNEHDIILDDMLFIFHKNIMHMGAYDKIKPNPKFGGAEHEWTQTEVYNERTIPLHIIGINLENVKHNVFSGNINLN